MPGSQHGLENLTQRYGTGNTGITLEPTAEIATPMKTRARPVEEPRPLIRCAYFAAVSPRGVGLTRLNDNVSRSASLVREHHQEKHLLVFRAGQSLLELVDAANVFVVDLKNHDAAIETGCSSGT
jgi:hypothetical protein